MTSAHDKRLQDIRHVYDLLKAKGHNGPAANEGEVKDQKRLTEWIRNVAKVVQKTAISYAESLAWSGSIRPKVVDATEQGHHATEERWIADPHRPPTTDAETELHAHFDGETGGSS